jgi:hypothetical protein
VPAPAAIPDTTRVAWIDEADDRDTPLTAEAGGAMARRHSYEGLTRVDCQGEVHGGLAESWNSADGGRRWELVLREDARFWDGTAVTAAHVEAGWERTVAPETARIAGIDSATAVGDRVLRVFFSGPRPQAPQLLAEAEFAVVGDMTSSRWPLGTGSYAIAATDPSAGRVVASPAYGRPGPAIEFIALSRAEARDRLDRGVDVMVTGDPAVIDYVGAASELADIPLPWDRSYVLVSTTRVQELRRDSPVGALSSDLREAMARDAVRGEARGARPPAWWQDLRVCGELADVLVGLPPVPGGAYASSEPRRIVFALDDPVARDLAGRIVAIAGSRPSTSPEAVMLAAAIPGLGSGGRVGVQGLEGLALAESLRDGDDFAYVLAVRRQPLDPCFEARRLLSRVQWLAVEGVELSQALVPLVETRKHVIVRRGTVGLVLDGEGTVRVSSEARREGARR